jgi:hypothetical protein
MAMVSVTVTTEGAEGAKRAGGFGHHVTDHGNGDLGSVAPDDLLSRSI